jgi:hypothetical protein
MGNSSFTTIIQKYFYLEVAVISIKIIHIFVSGSVQENQVLDSNGQMCNRAIIRRHLPQNPLTTDSHSKVGKCQDLRASITKSLLKKDC